MEKQTLELLEFNQILDAISSCAATPGGSELIYRQVFDTDIELLNYKKNIVSDWKLLLQSDLKKPDVYFPEIKFIKKLEKEGTVLEGIELADAATFIKSSILQKKYCLKSPENIELSGCLKNEAEQIIELEEYSNAIFREINSDGSVKEDHHLLRSARSRIASIHSQINKFSGRMLNDNRDIWQVSVPSQRDGRTVLALKSNYRSRVKGLIHEVSSSGATIFIEPFEIVELNNELAYEQSQLQQQITRIYKSLTEKLREAVGSFELLVEHISLIDTYFARAVYSIKNKSIRPLDRENGIKIIKGRHPLLGKNAVPISLDYSDEITILIITGPNAGGKTVTLKTCGIFVLLNQFACELPAEEGTAIGIYKNIYADIGDDQSIEESLSTFSGHMSRISSIIKNASKGSLVLLDELGSGTDPEQGSAIAMGILENFRKKMISTILTTHHAAVKNFGYTHERALNASVAFDSLTMKPTYEIIEGLPGESHAIEIAQSCGICDEIIEISDQYLNKGESTVSGMIKELELRQNDILQRDRMLKEAEALIKEDRRSIDLLRLKLKQQEHILKNREYTELTRYVNNSRKDLENLVRELREGEITREKTKKVKAFIKEMDKKVETASNEIREEEIEIYGLNSTEQTIEFIPGMPVRHKKNKKVGTLIEARKDDEWIVAFGNIRFNVKSTDLEFTGEKTNTAEKIRITSPTVKHDVSFELDIRGMRVYEAENALVKQIDSAILNGINSFSIIHGLGEGILQQAVHDYLSGCSIVKDFQFSDPEHGGFGKTIVRLNNGL